MPHPAAKAPIEERLARVGLAGLERRAWIEVDLGVLTGNARALRAQVGDAELGAVVKADGYGHGLGAVARAAVEGGATYLIVATVAEGLRLRRDGYGGRLLVLYPIPPGQIQAASDHALEVVAGSAADVEMLVMAQRPVAVHLEVDTGMGRGGVGLAAVADAARSIEAAPNLDLRGIWSHLFAPADPAITALQVARFSSALEGVKSGRDRLLRHLNASGGIMTAVEHYDLVRAGLVLYGHSPIPSVALPEGIEPALSLRAMPVHFADLERGDTVGYDGDWMAPGPTRVATLPLGYADGWSRSSSPGTRVLAGEEVAEVVGRISSDAMTIDVTSLSEVSIDTEVTILGDASPATAEEVAKVRSTISWEVLQQLSSRLARIYHFDGEVVGIRRENQLSIEWLGDDRARTVGSYGLPLP